VAGHSSMRRSGGARVVALAAAALALAPGARAADQTVWKPVTGAVFKLDGHPAKHWNIYGTKKRGRVLVELGRRFLVLDLKAKQVFALDSAAVERRGDELRSPRAGRALAPLASAGWDLRDVGPAEQIRVELTDEGHVLEIQLPHPLDLRGIY
jgi:hypothetical protein